MRHWQVRVAEQKNCIRIIHKNICEPIQSLRKENGLVDGTFRASVKEMNLLMPWRGITCI